MTATLILIDLQQGLLHPTYWGGALSSGDVPDKARSLLAHWRERGWPVRHVFHDSTTPESELHPSKPGNAPIAGLEPKAGESVYRKSVNSAFIGTMLEGDLRAAGERELVICGLTTNHCVSTSTRMAGNLGFAVRLVGDACAAHAQGGFDAATIHAVSLANLDGEFCEVVATDSLLS